MNRLFAALYVSEMWHSYWRHGGRLHGKARAVVLFDRVIACNDSRMSINSMPLESVMCEGEG